ncbi:hypothetical protein KSZ_10160 [Dictyobacter formicarum]|uniref:Uncharacterized protein n=1 Tax=Dictyobacter formicarum TaxID=2778368 RepID=A0ABQ3VB46_9CHLR|nr:hypothetical protein KSZ_10160 [Dictyobacter formicarum]
MDQFFNSLAEGAGHLIYHNEHGTFAPAQYNGEGVFQLDRSDGDAIICEE